MLLKTLQFIKDHEVFFLILTFTVITMLYFILHNVLKSRKVELTVRNEYVFYEKQNKLKSLIDFIITILCVLGMILLFRIADNVIIAVLLCLLLFCIYFGVSLFYLKPKMLIVGCDRVRYPLHWKFDWSEVEGCTVNKEKRMLLLFVKNKNYSFPFIKEGDVEKLEDVIEECLKNRKGD
jgi:hypothetical protein